MTVFRNDNQWGPSNVLFEGGRIVRYDKAARTPEMRYIDYGLSVLSAPALNAYPADAAFDLARVFQDLVGQGRLAAAEVTTRFYEIGSARRAARHRGPARRRRAAR